MSQQQKVIDILKSQGEISRNVCIRELFITRLSAIIQDLELEGWEFVPEYRKTERGKDYVYIVKTRPTKVIQVPEITEINGQMVAVMKPKTIYA